MEKQQKIAIFGGSFDPPHYGHLDIVRNLEKIFDRVIVVPSYISPFKSGATDAAVRFKLCKKFFTSAKTEVSKREISKKGVSYSVDTAAYFAKKLDAKLFWVIGSEELARLSEWRDIDRLKTLVTFFVVPRPGFDIDRSPIKELKKRKIKFKIANFCGLDISSTGIKLDLAFDKPNKNLPSDVYALAKKHGYFNVYGKYVDAYAKYGMSERRITHTYGVAVRGAELAKLYGANVTDAVVACLLHDIAKSVDANDYNAVVDATGFPPPTVHAAIGAYIAKRDFDVSDEIAHAIRVHATGDGGMSLLDEVVYLADKTEMWRNYSEVYYFRYLCTVDKDLALFAIMTAVTDFKGNLPCEMTTRAIAEYKEKCGARTMPEMPKREQKQDDAPSKLPMKRQSSSPVSVASKALRPVPDKSESKALRPMPDKKDAKALRTVPEKSPMVVSDTAEHGRKKADKKADKKAVSEERAAAEAVAKELDLHKAYDIDIIDLGGKTIIADYFVIASATSTTAVKALCGYVEDRMTKDFGLDPLRRDVNKEWVALDYGSLIVHIFTENMREFYNIERLWSDGNNVTRYKD